MSTPLIATLNRSGTQSLSATYSDLSAVSLTPGVYLLHTAGQVGIPPPSSSVQGIPPSFREQAQNAFQNVAACLALKGATPQDIVKITIYVVNYNASLRQDIIEVISSFFTTTGGQRHTPPSSLLGVANLALPEFLIEVEAVAVVKG